MGLGFDLGEQNELEDDVKAKVDANQDADVNSVNDDALDVEDGKVIDKDDDKIEGAQEDMK